MSTDHQLDRTSYDPKNAAHDDTAGPKATIQEASGPLAPMDETLVGSNLGNTPRSETKGSAATENVQQAAMGAEPSEIPLDLTDMAISDDGIEPRTLPHQGTGDDLGMERIDLFLTDTDARIPAVLLRPPRSEQEAQSHYVARAEAIVKDFESFFPQSR